MWRGKKTHCVNGHKRTARNVRMKVRPDGVVYRQCRMCEAARDRLRYQNNPARRASVIARSMAQHIFLLADRNKNVNVGPTP